MYSMIERFKIKNILDKCIKLSYIYQSKTRYDTLIQNVILKESINLMSNIRVDIDIELNWKLVE